METLAMSLKERRRLEMFNRVRDGALTLRKASELLKLSYRQAKRAYARYRSEGDAGVVHRLRGRSCGSRVASDRRIASGVLVGSIAGNWSSWMVLSTTGSKVVGRRRC